MSLILKDILNVTINSTSDPPPTPRDLRHGQGHGTNVKWKQPYKAIFYYRYY